MARGRSVSSSTALCACLFVCVLVALPGVRSEIKVADASHQVEFQENHQRAKLRDGLNNPDQVEIALKEVNGYNGLKAKSDLNGQHRPAVFATYRDATVESERSVADYTLAGNESQQTQERYPTIYVFINTLVMALASGLGAVPFFFVRTLSKQLVGTANAVACGVMLACSFDLIHEGEPYGAMLVVVGIVLGMVFVNVSQKYLSQYEDVKFESLKGAGARKTLLVVGIMAAHAIGEGSGVGVAYAGGKGWSQGVLVTLAIGLHNIPEGLAVATVMVSRGVAAKQAAMWAVLTSLPQTLVAVPSYLFVEAFTACLPVAMGFAAGSMIWVVFSELMPDALEDMNHGGVATAATMSAAWLEGLRMLLSKLETRAGTLSSPIQASPDTIFPALIALLPVGLICCALCYVTKTSLTPRPGVLGASVGMQTGLAIIAVLREAFRKDGSLVSSAIWCGLGAVVMAGMCMGPTTDNSKKEKEGGSPRVMSRPVDLTRDPLDPPGELPTTWPPLTSFSKPISGMWLAVAMLGLFAGLEGFKLAFAVVKNVNHVDHVMFPGSLLGVLFGVMAGLSILTYPMNRKTTFLSSLILGSLPAAIAFGLLLTVPFGRSSIPGPILDPYNHLGKVSCLVGGAVLVVNRYRIWPSVRGSFPGGPKLGFALGGLTSFIVHGILGAFCFGTPYCLS
ncbi:hypothetical protein BSKO_13777 [Bryopsis sp. KO-2023]|nr:hypothetical protein BSKO_13777 [Bryopsis sp. KO-2023]